MPGPFDFTGQNISNTYQRVVQVISGSLHDGTGSLFIPLSASYAITASYAVSASHEIVKEISSSYAETASFANNFVVQNSLTASNISASFYYGDGSNLTGIETDPFPYTGSAIISGSLEVIGDITGSGKLNLDTNNSVVIGNNTTNGGSDVVIGKNAKGNGTGVAIGYNAWARSYNSVAIGRDATAGGTYNVSIGWYANQGATTGFNSVYIGYNTGRGNNNSNNTIVGGRSLYFTDGENNVVIGKGALDGGGSGNDRNVVLGTDAGTRGSDNVLIGYQAGLGQDISNKLIITNTGSKALITGDFANSTLDISGSVSASTYYGDGSNLMGVQSPISYQENTSSNSLALGEGTVLGGGNNVIIGDGSSINLSGGYENTIIGANTNFTGITKGFVGIGRNASGPSQQDSVLIGAASTGGSGAARYVGIGQGARLGSRTVAIGWRAGNIGSTYSVFLGHEAGYNETTSNRLYIANSNTSTPLIYGEFDNNKILINGELSASSAINASTYYGDGSNLTGIETDPFPYTGSAIITGSLTVSGSVVDFTSASAVNLNIDSLPLINPIVEYLDVTSSISSGTSITLPNNLSYVSSSVYEYLEVFMNGLRLRYNRDFAPTSNTTIQNQIAFPSGSELTFKSLKR